MNSSLLDPFVQGVEELLSSMLGVSAEVVGAGNPCPCFVSGVVSIQGDSNGQMALSFPRDAAVLFVADMLGLDPSEVDSDMMQDGIGEMANIVAGGAKAKLARHEHKIVFSLPSIVTGENHTLTLFRGGELEIRQFETERGTFRLLLWIAVD